MGSKKRKWCRYRVLQAGRRLVVERSTLFGRHVWRDRVVPAQWRQFDRWGLLVCRPNRDRASRYLRGNCQQYAFRNLHADWQYRGCNCSRHEQRLFGGEWLCRRRKPSRLQRYACRCGRRHGQRGREPDFLQQVCFFAWASRSWVWRRDCCAKSYSHLCWFCDIQL